MKKLSIFPLLSIMFFDNVCLTITFPILTLLFFDNQSRLFSPDTTYAVRSMWYGLCVAVPHVVNILATPLLSSLSDVYGRKKILLLGTFGALLFAITAALGIVWGLLSVLFLGRFIQGAFSRTQPIAQAIIGDISPREKKVRYMGYLQTSISIGAFAGPVLGGYFANQFFFSTLNYSLPYFLAAIFGLISFILTLFLFKETLAKQSSSFKEHFSFQSIKVIFSNPNVWRISVILLLSQISWSTYYQFMPPILKTVLHFDAHALGIFVGLVAFWLALATTFGIKILERFFNINYILKISLYWVLAGSLMSYLFCFFPLKGYGSLFVWLAAIPTAMGDVIAYSCLTAMYSNSVEKEAQGKVMGVCFTVIGLIWSLTAIVGGMLMSIQPLLPLLIAPLGILFAVVLTYVSSFKRLF
jgi:DHA1 family tetracycline resistance protein-like MFS transporter